VKPSPFTLTAPKLVAATTVGILAGDAWLIRRQRQSVSKWAGHHFLKVAACNALLLMHFKGWPRFMKRFDLLAAAGRWLGQARL